MCIDSCIGFLSLLLCRSLSTLHCFCRDPIEIQEIKDEIAAKELALNPPPVEETKEEVAAEETTEESKEGGADAVEEEVAPTEE